METLKHKFTEVIPDSLEDGILYVSMERSVALHLCVCGCRNEVVTPLSPTDWKLIFNGVSISLRPSIGNWNFKCKSHYFITEGKIEHASKWSDRVISDGRRQDKKSKEKYYKKITPSEHKDEVSIAVPSERRSLFKRICIFLGIKLIMKSKGGILNE